MIIVACFSVNYSSVEAQATYIDEETSAPYGFLDMGFYANYIRYNGYSLSNNESTSVRSGFGAGLEGHFPIIYLFVHQNKHRFRIADDFVLGVSVNPGIEGGTQSSRAGISAVYGLGIQSVYRINETFDIGIKYYPIYFRGDAQMGHTNSSAYAFHARADRFYLDYRLIPEVIESHLESSGINLLSLKYLYTPITSDKSYYLSLTSGWARYSHTGYFASAPIAPFKWDTMQFSWGIYF